MSSKAQTELDTKSPAANARYVRKVRRHKSTAANALTELSRYEEPARTHKPLEPETGLAKQTYVCLPLYLAMEDERQSFRTKNTRLKELVLTLSNAHCIDEFIDKDDKVKYYTGLPTFKVLNAVYRKGNC